MATDAKKILLVDDDAVNLTSTAQRLITRGYQVEPLRSGTAALAPIKGAPPDVVLLDIMMPGISGLDVLKELRTRFSHVELPVIMVTAKESAKDVTGALKLGANDYIPKPINIEVAVARIETQLTTSRLHRELLLKKELEAVHAMIVTYNHEINNPLAVALANVDLTTKTGDASYLEKARTALLRVADIVKRIAAVEEHGVTYEKYVNDTKMVAIKKAQ
jgi:DNA-binding response OmpR family regulator